MHLRDSAALHGSSADILSNSRPGQLRLSHHPISQRGSQITAWLLVTGGRREPCFQLFDHAKTEMFARRTG
jgi:hypothetical protein